VLVEHWFRALQSLLENRGSIIISAMPRFGVMSFVVSGALRAELASPSTGTGPALEWAAVIQDLETGEYVAVGRRAETVLVASELQGTAGFACSRPPQ